METIMNLYLDESNHLQNDNKKWMGVGFLSCPKIEVRAHSFYLKKLMQGYNHNNELKWTKIGSSNLEVYSSVFSYFLSQSNLKFRMVLIDKAKIRQETDWEDFYYKMMYQLIKIIEPHSKVLNLFFDYKDSLSNPRINTLKDILCKKSLHFSEVQNIRSHESILLQVCDIILGAIVAKNENEVTSVSKLSFIEQIETKTGLKLDTSTSYNGKIDIFKINLRDEHIS